MTLFYALHQEAGVDFACGRCLSKARAELLVDSPELAIAALPKLGSDECGWCGAHEADRVDAYLDEADERRAVMGGEWG